MRRQEKGSVPLKGADGVVESRISASQPPRPLPIQWLRDISFWSRPPLLGKEGNRHSSTVNSFMGFSSPRSHIGDFMLIKTRTAVSVIAVSLLCVFWVAAQQPPAAVQGRGA